MLEIEDQVEGLDVFKMLKDTGSIMEGHFKLTSGYHSKYYLQCAKLLQYPGMAEKLAGRAVELLGEDLDIGSINAIVAPAVGGILWGYALASRIGCRMIFTERKESRMEIRRGFKLEAGEKVIIAEDVITTGGSVKEVIGICRQADADIKAVISIVDRAAEVDFGIPYYHMIRINIEKYHPSKCQLCRSKIPVDYPGSKKQIS